MNQSPGYARYGSWHGHCWVAGCLSEVSLFPDSISHRLLGYMPCYCPKLYNLIAVLKHAQIIGLDNHYESLILPKQDAGRIKRVVGMLLRLSTTLSKFQVCLLISLYAF